jgi:hypothetical protein
VSERAKACEIFVYVIEREQPLSNFGLILAHGSLLAIFGTLLTANRKLENKVENVIQHIKNPLR